MKKEIKISLPFYKLAYSFFFVLVLSLVRGVSFSFEIGVALEAPMALLAAVFCADTYVQEISSKRSEIERLYPMKNRLLSIFRRTGVQELYLLMLAALGYGLFYIFQRPLPLGGAEAGAGEELALFWMYLAAMAITQMFWGSLSLTLACLFHSIWAGIGSCLVLWIATNSTLGDRLFGKWNLFSYSFRILEDGGGNGWICGKILCIVFCIVMAAALPQVIKKRG